MHRKTVPTIRLRKEQFRRHFRLLGLETTTAQAEHLGLSKWTITRLMNDNIAPGETVIASALAAFPALRFEDLFELIEVGAKGNAA